MPFGKPKKRKRSGRGPILHTAAAGSYTKIGLSQALPPAQLRPRKSLPLRSELQNEAPCRTAEAERVSPRVVCRSGKRDNRLQGKPGAEIGEGAGPAGDGRESRLPLTTQCTCYLSPKIWEVVGLGVQGGAWIEKLFEGCGEPDRPRLC